MGNNNSDLSASFKVLLNHVAILSTDTTLLKDEIPEIKKFYEPEQSKDIDDFITYFIKIRDNDYTDDDRQHMLEICESLTRGLTFRRDEKNSDQYHRYVVKNRDSPIINHPDALNSNPSKSYKFFYLLERANSLLTEKSGGGDFNYTILIYALVFVVLYLLCTIVLNLPDAFAGIIGAVGLYLVGYYKLLSI